MVREPTFAIDSVHTFVIVVPTLNVLTLTMYILLKLSTVDKDNGTISSNELSGVVLITSFKYLIGVSVELSVSIFATVDIGCVIISIFITVNDDVNTFTIPVLTPVIIVLFNVDIWNSTELSPVTLVDIN